MSTITDEQPFAISVSMFTSNQVVASYIYSEWTLHLQFVIISGLSYKRIFSNPSKWLRRWSNITLHLELITTMIILLFRFRIQFFNIWTHTFLFLHFTGRVLGYRKHVDNGGDVKAMDEKFINCRIVYSACSVGTSLVLLQFSLEWWIVTWTKAMKAN